VLGLKAVDVVDEELEVVLDHDVPLAGIVGSSSTARSATATTGPTFPGDCRRISVRVHERAAVTAWSLTGPGLASRHEDTHQRHE
jgi:hypothetical protein